MTNTWCAVIESHYLETVEGLFFAVKGLVHPADRIVACLRYAPDAAGERAAGGRRYRRLYHFAEQVAWLQDHYPHYLAFDPMCQATLQSVPHTLGRRVYDPQARLAELRDERRPSALAEAAVAFADLLAEAAGIPVASMGVSGSLLIGLDRPASDLDITVYGLVHGRAVAAALHRLLDAGTCRDLARLDGEGMAALYAERVADTHMARADFVRVERNKINQGQFRGRPYFIRFVPVPGEIAERYGDYRYSPAGRAAILATVEDARAGIFTPCRYPVTEVVGLAGTPPADLREIVSFRGRFCEQAQAGDRVQVCGQVERVQDRTGTSWHRLLLGNSPEDSMILRGGL